MITLKESETGGISMALGDDNKYVDLGLKTSREDFMGLTYT
jgi:hypothetical protein